MAEYRVARVSDQTPREWDNPKGGRIYYIKVMLEGHDKPVAVGKRKPDALSVGQVIHGTIQPKPDFPEDGFKPDAMDQPHSASNYTPRDDAAIKAQFAIKAAIQYSATQNGIPAMDDIEGYAQMFFGMVERVKQGSVSPVQAQQKAMGTYDQDTIAESSIPF